VTAGPATVATLTEQLQRQLGSDDLKEVAWGAYLAAQNQRRSLVPVLQERLAALPVTNGSVPPTDGSLPAAMAILDALVQLDAKLPAQTLGPWFDRCPVQTLILLANASSGRDEQLLSLLESTSGSRWQAAANLLLMTKPPGFARWLLTGLRLRLTLFVTDQPGISIGSGSGGGSSGEDGNYSVRAEGFPPLADYRFAGAVPGATILALGPRPVYYIRRVEGPPGSYAPHGNGKSLVSNLDRVQYIDTLATGRYEAGPLFDEMSATVLWTNAQDLQQRIGEERRRVDSVYERVVSQLVVRGYLSPEEAVIFHPEIAVTVSDQRKNKSEPLPAVQ
jgi:hypothetical protein